MEKTQGHDLQNKTGSKRKEDYYNLHMHVYMYTPGLFLQSHFNRPVGAPPPALLRVHAAARVTDLYAPAGGAVMF